MKVLITGGAGYIGSHAALSFLDSGHSVSIIDNLVNGKKEIIPKKAKFYLSDISDKENIDIIIQENRFDLVLHFAAYTSVKESVENPKKYFDNNFEKSKIFFDCCIKNGLRKIIYSSTAGVYGDISKNKILENEKVNPINPYSESKLNTEKYLIELNKKNNLNIVILRYFNAAGADVNLRSGLVVSPDNLIKAVCEYVTKKREKLIVNGDKFKTKDGTTIRDYIHVSDLADMHRIVSEDLLKESSNGYKIFNCGYGKGHSILEVINCMSKIINKEIHYTIGSNRPGDSEISIADVKKFKNKFNWKPKFDSLEIILKSALEWEKKI